MGECNNQIWVIDLDTLWFPKTTGQKTIHENLPLETDLFWSDFIRDIFVWLNFLDIPSFNLYCLSLVSDASTPTYFWGIAFSRMWMDMDPAMEIHDQNKSFLLSH